MSVPDPLQVQVIRPGQRYVGKQGFRFVVVMAIGVFSATISAWSTSQAQAGSPTLGRHLPPRDDARLDKEFVDFRNRLLEAAEKGDRAVLRACMSHSIRTLDGSATPDQLLDALGLQAGRRWSELADALRAGVARSTESGGFVAPHFAEDWLEFDESLVFGSGVFLRSRPGVSEPVVRQLSYEVIRVRQHHLQKPNEEWSEVETADGVAGFVAARFLRSPYDVRFYFARENGRWKLVAYAVGD